MAATGSGLLVIERILRDREGIWRQIADERDLNPLVGQMLASSTVALACFGAVLGSFNGVLMTLTSAVKLPLLFLATLAICLPALYLFNLVFGARLSVRQALALVMTAITVISMLSVAFAPISLFFRTPATVVAPAAADGAARPPLDVPAGGFDRRPGSADGRSGNMALLYVWIVLFGFVGTQLAWTLRPFFGAPTEDFALFRQIEGNFYVSILKDLANLF